jgi:hypothetical protein
MTYDQWLQSAADYERFCSLDGPSEEGLDAEDREIELRIDEICEDWEGFPYCD